MHSITCFFWGALQHRALIKENMSIIRLLNCSELGILEVELQRFDYRVHTENLRFHCSNHLL